MVSSSFRRGNGSSAAGVAWKNDVGGLRSYNFAKSYSWSRIECT